MSEGVSEMEEGIVKFFDSRDNKRFGFIIDENGKEIFFHFNDGENIIAGKEDAVFSEGKLRTEPKKGDAIVFIRTPGSKGPKASPWGFAQDYDRATMEIDSRSAPDVFRVMKQTTVCGNAPGKPEVLWEGSDIRLLCAKYPRTSDHRVDDLYSTFSCGDFSHQIWFEIKTENGWKDTKDPRPISSGRRRRW